MIVTRYVCDKCGKSFSSSGRMKTIAIKFADGTRYPFNGNNYYNTYSKLYCAECFNKLKIEKTIKKETTDQYLERPTFDELVRDIITEMTGAV